MGCFGSKEKVLNLDPNKLTLDHFEKLRVIGRGAFGKVHAVSRRDTKVLYAMKVLDKAEIVNQRMAQNVINERFILAALQYPLIVNLQCALQSPVDLFMIVDLMQGGDVRYHMRQDKRFTEERVRFYCAQTALALNFLHSQGYVHRDIKPDNLLLDTAGNCHLTDFNLSVRLTDDGVRGIAGTRPYMAPEVLQKKLYRSEVDWWSFGVMLYEMMFWRLPFTGDADKLRYSILNDEPRFPKDGDKNLVALLRGLLDKDPSTRFGFNEVKASPFFKGLEWEQLEKKTAPTPWQPDPNRANCDGSYDLDEQFEVKKKRYPLPPEQEALFAQWDWQPGQKDEDVPNIVPENKERRYDEDEAGADLVDDDEEEGGHSSHSHHKHRKSSSKSRNKAGGDDSHTGEEHSAEAASKSSKKGGKKDKPAKEEPSGEQEKPAPAPAAEEPKKGKKGAKKAEEAAPAAEEAPNSSKSPKAEKAKESPKAEKAEKAAEPEPEPEAKAEKSAEDSHSATEEAAKPAAEPAEEAKTSSPKKKKSKKAKAAAADSADEE